MTERARMNWKSSGKLFVGHGPVVDTQWGVEYGEEAFGDQSCVMNITAPVFGGNCVGVRVLKKVIVQGLSRCDEKFYFWMQTHQRFFPFEAFCVIVEESAMSIDHFQVAKENFRLVGIASHGSEQSQWIS